MLAICLSMLESPEDRESFAALYEGCKGRAFYLARRIVGRDDLAEDAVQEGFVYLAQHYRRLKHSGKQNLEGYLFDCVESRAVDLLRRSGRESEEEADFSAVESEEADVERRLVAAEQLEAAVAAIDALEEIYRVTLTLHYQGGWSIQHIAEATGVSKKAAQKRLERARAKVWQTIRRNDEDATDTDPI